MKHAKSVDELRKLLQTQGGEVIFTTIEKFQLNRDSKGNPIETEHPVLSDRSDILVIADEAHRSQYGLMEGYARYLSEALPNARRLGFTGTPVSFSGADTVDVFGDLIHTYDMRQSQEDQATVPIFYEPRQVKLYEALSVLPDCPEMKIIMTGNLSKDPPAWSEAGHITTKEQRDSIKTRMVDPHDLLKIVVVCDMWLTGTDIPCLHTLYIDKPMKGHNMIQAISRVNRVFSDKPHGLIVDYIGIGDDLRDATNTYTAGGGRGEPAPDVSTEAVPVFMECLATVRGMLPEGIDYGDWRHLDPCRQYADEIIFYQRARKQILKTIPSRRASQDVDKAVRDLTDDAVESEGVVDIFKIAGIERADISILDETCG